MSTIINYIFDREEQYKEFSIAYTGLQQIILPDGTYKTNKAFYYVMLERKLTIFDGGYQKTSRTSKFQTFLNQEFTVCPF